MNGVLLSRILIAEESKSDYKPILRPFCVDFLEFVSGLFEVCVWTCSTLDEVAEKELEVLFGKQRPKILHQMHSIRVSDRSSVEVEGKPLFLKDISMVSKHLGLGRFFFVGVSAVVC